MDSERMLFLYDFLNRRTNAEKGVTIEEIQRYLAEEKNMERVSAATIRRDLERIMYAGYDIDIRRGPHNTHFYHMKGKPFKFNEIRFIVDSISINKFLSPEQKRKLIHKFEGLCSESEVRQLMSRVSISTCGAPSLDLLENLDAIHRIIAEKRTLNFDYGKMDAQRHFHYHEKSRTLLPCQVIYFSERFYLKCYSVENSHLRTYRIDRMRNIVAGEKFRQLPEIPKPDGAVLDIFEPKYYELVTLRVKRFLPDDMLEQLGAYASAQDAPDNRSIVLVRARIGINDSFHRWVMKYGGNVEILRPENLRREFAEKVAELYRQYWD